MVDWMNPSEDALEGKRVGYDEGRESRDEEVAELEEKVRLAAMDVAKLSLLACEQEHCLKRPIVPGKPSVVEQALGLDKHHIVPGLRLSDGDAFVVDCPLCKTSLDAKIGHRKICSGCGKEFLPALVKDCDDNVLGVSIGWCGEAFTVRCDEDLNPPEKIEQGIMTAEVGIPVNLDTIPVCEKCGSINQCQHCGHCSKCASVDDGIRGRESFRALMEGAGFSRESIGKYAEDRLNPDYYNETELRITEAEDGVKIESGPFESTACITGDCGECRRCKQVAEYKDVKTLRERYRRLYLELEQAHKWVCRLISRSNPGLRPIPESVGEADVTACEQRLNYVHEQWKAERLKRRQLEREIPFLKSERGQMKEALDMVSEGLRREIDDAISEDMKTDKQRRAAIRVTLMQGGSKDAPADGITNGTVFDLLDDLDLVIRMAKAYSRKLGEQLFEIDKDGRIRQVQCEKCASKEN